MVSRVLFGLALMLAFSATAFAGDKQNDDSTTPQVARDARIFTVQSPKQRAFDLDWPFSMPRSAPVVSEADQTCYVLRVYHVERRSNQNGGGRVSHVSTCTPGTRFSLKSAKNEQTGSK